MTSVQDELELPGLTAADPSATRTDRSPESAWAFAASSSNARRARKAAACPTGPVPPSTYAAIRASGPCVYCDGTATTVDHIRPLARGGWEHEDNLVPACAPCNKNKKARLLTEWDRSDLVTHGVAHSLKVAAEYGRLVLDVSWTPLAASMPVQFSAPAPEPAVTAVPPLRKPSPVSAEPAPEFPYEQIAGRLESRIRGGELRPGSMLPGERRLAVEYRTAILTVRKATRILRERGLVVTRAHMGSFVAREIPPPVPDRPA